MEDTADGDLLSELPCIVEFLAEGVSLSRRTLVHCVAGVSRSAAAVCALLVSPLGAIFAEPDDCDCDGGAALSAKAALRVLRRKAPHAEPNEGFMEQLELWRHMGCCPAEQMEGKAEYRRWRTDRQARGVEPRPGEAPEERQQGGETERRRQEEEGSDGQLAAQAQADTRPPPHQSAAAVKRSAATSFLCRKCRKPLFDASEIVPHERGEGQRAFRHTKRDKDRRAADAADAAACASHFLEPPNWSPAVQQGDMEGKLHCPHCDYRIGAFSWHGAQCSCGAWVTPSFAVHANRVDSPPARAAFAAAAADVAANVAAAAPKPLGKATAPAGATAFVDPSAAEAQIEVGEDIGSRLAALL